MRFTPAYAGKIDWRRQDHRADEVHPRIRGEDFFVVSASGICVGSPPHTRGRLPDPERRGLLQGFTPAYAGKIAFGADHILTFRVHPRIRGEDPDSVDGVNCMMGSPPHTRGRFLRVSALRRLARFTPAYAGKILLMIFRCPPLWVHPRIRGEDS